MRKLVENGRFPLTAFVIVDPDEIRHRLPEFHMYVEENPELAGSMTRKEAGFIAEILTLAALQAGKNVLQDGSLRDSDWYVVFVSSSSAYLFAIFLNFVFFPWILCSSRILSFLQFPFFISTNQSIISQGTTSIFNDCAMTFLVSDKLFST